MSEKSIKRPSKTFWKLILTTRTLWKRSERSSLGMCQCSLLAGFGEHLKNMRSVQSSDRATPLTSRPSLGAWSVSLRIKSTVSVTRSKKHGRSVKRDSLEFRMVRVLKTFWQAWIPSRQPSPLSQCTGIISRPIVGCHIQDKPNHQD